MNRDRAAGDGGLTHHGAVGEHNAAIQRRAHAVGDRLVIGQRRILRARRRRQSQHRHHSQQAGQQPAAHAPARRPHVAGTAAVNPILLYGIAR